ncbi:MAG: HNH endonuclease signature motif containing protein [Halioglobus sp.]
MKLEENMGQLWARVEEMGADRVEINLGEVWDDSEIEFDRELSTGGVEVSLEDLESEQGLLSVRGRQVILFIPDHAFRVEQVFDVPSQGNKFHIADCKTLETMRERKRFERYKVTNNLSGEFPIFGTGESSNRQIEGTAELNVCKNCLNMLNYEGAKNTSVAGRNSIVDVFSIADFFVTYSSVFKNLPRQLIDQAKKGYSPDWDEVSARVRSGAGDTCQCCEVDLTSKKSLLHAHHISGDKRDNAPRNLVALCADCHRKEPYHGHMFVKREHTELINRLRGEQGLLSTADTWQLVKRHVDAALLGVVDHCEKKRMPIAKVGYAVRDEKRAVVTELAMAWPTRKEGIYIGPKPDLPGWSLFNLQQALIRFG